MSSSFLVNKLLRVRSLAMLLALGLMNGEGCSTTEVAPPAPPIPPVYIQVPHPVGMDFSDLSAIFLDSGAPKDPSFSNNCDADYRKLTQLTQSIAEMEQGVRELVRQDPVHYHWCFYSKLVSLHNQMKNEIYIDVKQKAVLNEFQFLVPVARSFASEFHDSRYLRWAVFRYREMSQWVFFRKLELTPEGTSELVQPLNPFGLARNFEQSLSVLEKYHLLKSPEPGVSVAATPEPVPSPVPSEENTFNNSMPIPMPSGMPVMAPPTPEVPEK